MYFLKINKRKAESNFYSIVCIIAEEEVHQPEVASNEISAAARIITNLRVKTKRLLRDYIENLTIHGATKVLTGSIPEQIF